MITEAKWKEIAEYAQGTCHSTAALAGTFELEQEDEDRIQEKLLEHDLELCDQCGWWMDLTEMAPGECTEGESMCRDCAEAQGIEIPDEE